MSAPLSSPRAPHLTPSEPEASREEPFRSRGAVQVVGDIASVTADHAGSASRVRVRAIRVDGHGFLELQAPHVLARVDVYMLAKVCRALGVKL